MQWLRHYPFWLLLFLAASVMAILLISDPNNMNKNRDYGSLDLSTEEIQWLKDNKILYASIKPGWAPFSFMSEQGEFRGISIDYLSRIEHMLNIKFNRLNAREDIYQENADLLVGTTPPVIERNPRYRLLDKPYVVSEFAIYSKKSKPIFDMNSLHGKRVAVFKTGIVAKDLAAHYPDVELYAADIAEEAMDAVMTDRVDAYIGNSVVIDYTIQNQGFFDIQNTGTTPFKSEVYMAVKQTSPLLASILNKALAKIDVDEQREILQSWTQRSNTQRKFYLKILISTMSMAFIVIGFFYYNNVRLSREIQQRKQVEVSLTRQRNKAEKAEKKAKQYLHEIDALNSGLELKIIERTEDLEKQIEERKLIEKNLRETQSVLVEAEKMASLGGLVAGVAHEVNTPLGIGITAITHLKDKLNELLHHYQSGEMKRSDLEAFLKISETSVSIVFDNLSRASQLIKSFKEISVDQSGADIREIYLYEYLEQLLISLQPNIKRRPIQVDISSIPTSLRLRLEPGALAQIFTNLIMNSLTHAFEPEQAGLIKISANTEGKNLLLRYQDNGKGIANENLRKIFEPFFTTKRHRGGSGLGLNIVYNLVTRKFRGKIHVESEIDQGVQFLIEFPNCVLKK